MEKFNKELLSKHPYICYIPDFLEEDECNHLIEKSKAQGLAPATVYDDRSGRYVEDSIRSSKITSFPTSEVDVTLGRILKRLAAVTCSHVAQGEPLQVMRYQPGERYLLHGDFFPEDTPGEAKWRQRGQRVWTVLLYLNDSYEGGETAFPKAGIAIKGDKCGALVFRNVGQNLLADELSIHAGMPVMSGEKWLASLWIRERP